MIQEINCKDNSLTIPCTVVNPVFGSKFGGKKSDEWQNFLPNNLKKDKMPVINS